MGVSTPPSGTYVLYSWGGPRPVDGFQRLRRKARRAMVYAVAFLLAVVLGLGAAGLALTLVPARAAAATVVSAAD